MPRISSIQAIHANQKFLEPDRFEEASMNHDRIKNSDEQVNFLCLIKLCLLAGRSIQCNAVSAGVIPKAWASFPA
jgi:hypothetical protein